MSTFLHEHLHVYVFMCTTCMPGAHGGDNRASDTAGTGITVMNHTCATGTELDSSVRALNGLNH